MSQALDITQEQAETILQLRLQVDKFAGSWMVVCKGYEDDWEEYTEVTPEDLDQVAEGCYDHFQLWPIIARQGRNGGRCLYQQFHSRSTKSR